MIRRIKLFRYHFILLKALYEKISGLINYPFTGSKKIKDRGVIPALVQLAALQGPLFPSVVSEKA